MIILFVGILLFLISYLRRYKYSPYWGFLFPFIIMAFQSGVKGDFEGYLSDFLSGDHGYTIKETEFAWLYINEIFQPFGFYPMLFCISLFECFICAYYVENYLTRNKKWLGALVFFFTFGCMLIQMKAMRQGVAMECVLLAFILAEKHKYIPSILAGVVAYGFHNSSVSILPILVLYLIYQISKKKYFPIFSYIANLIHNSHIRQSSVVVLGIGIFIFYILKSTFLNNYILPLAMSQEDFVYSGYLEELGDNNLSLWIVINMVIKGMAFGLLYMHSSKGRVFVVLSIFGLFANLFFWGFGNLMRITNYYTLFSIIAIPNACEVLKTKLKYGQLYSVVFILLYFIIELRSTLPWLLSSQNDGFATFNFIFQ